MRPVTFPSTPRRSLFLLTLTLAAGHSFEPAPENQISLAATAAAPLAQGSRAFADTTTTQFRVAHGTTLTFRSGAALLAGVALERFAFDAPSAAPVPSHLSSATL